MKLIQTCSLIGVVLSIYCLLKVRQLHVRNISRVFGSINKPIRRAEARGSHHYTKWTLSGHQLDEENPRGDKHPPGPANAKVKTLYILIDQLDSRRLLDKDALWGPPPRPHQYSPLSHGKSITRPTAMAMLSLLKYCAANAPQGRTTEREIAGNCGRKRGALF